MTDLVVPVEADALPDAPNRGDPAPVFSADAAAFTGAMGLFGLQMNALAVATYQNALATIEAATDLAAAADLAGTATDMFGRSTSTLAVGAGTKTIHLMEPAVGFAVNDQVAIVLRADPTIRMLGQIATFDGSDDMTVTVVSSGVFGSGTFANWVVMSATFLTAGATDEEMWAGETDAAAVSPRSLRLAAAFQTLTEAEIVAGWSAAAKGFNWKVTLTANRVVGAPTDLQDGVTYTFQPIQGGAGSKTLSWNAIWDFGAPGAPVLSTAVGKEDKIVAQYNAARNKLEANFRRAA